MKHYETDKLPKVDINVKKKKPSLNNNTTIMMTFEALMYPVENV
jgi:hypothetical protein